MFMVSKLCKVSVVPEDRNVAKAMWSKLNRGMKGLKVKSGRTFNCARFYTEV